ncbi:MAG: hypothetical protein HYW01_08530 [Deltaproteobacteria bacterium]|nr:hypothetical protein [Deltaproteobacteria bacterium]
MAMLSSIAKKPVTGLTCIFILIVISVPFQKRIDDIRGNFRAIEETLYLSSSALKKISLGYKEIVADIYWLRAIQYFGSKKVKEQDPELLYKYFDILTDLDPQFVNAYRFGGTFLTEPPPYGLGDVDKGIKLFDKGRENNPDNFRIPLEEAFIYYLYDKNYERAAELFNEASEKPGLSGLRRASIKGMAASAHNYGGNRQLSKKIWREIYETTTNEGRRNFALRNIEELNTMDMEDRLTQALREYIKRYNEEPKTLDALKDTGIIKQIPKEPLGGKFIIASKLKAVKSSTLVDQQFKQNLGFLASRIQKFKKVYDRYPIDVAELKDFIDQGGVREFTPHPLGEDYVYNPKTGVIGSN